MSFNLGEQYLSKVTIGLVEKTENSCKAPKKKNFQFGKKNAMHCFVFYFFLEQLLLDYPSKKMRGYPQFSFWIPIALAKIYFSRIVINCTKYFGISRHRPKGFYKTCWLRVELCSCSVTVSLVRLSLSLEPIQNITDLFPTAIHSPLCSPLCNC